MNHDQLLHAVSAIAIAAGARILEVYNRSESPQVNLKLDQSPITEADRLAHACITTQLAALTPEIPVLSEESDAVAESVRRAWPQFWLVDPLDGTKEFLQRNGEFTVNIALIVNGGAVLGVVHVPVSGSTYSGSLDTGAFVQKPNAAPVAIHAASMPADRRRVRVVASRRHRDRALEKLLQHLRSSFADMHEVSMGSSLKLCLLAEGKADIYPRLAPTSEWDTAAAHAILAAAGGDIVTLQFQPLRYNQGQTLLNPYFIALADPAYDWPTTLQAGLSLDKPWQNS